MLERWFSKFATITARGAGHPVSFVVAVLVILVWAVTGPLFHFSDTWQLVINTGTTIVTFLMVFLIQNSQNRDSTAMQLKLDEIIRSQQGAANKMMDIEELSYEDLEYIRHLYERLAKRARVRERMAGNMETDVVDMEIDWRKRRNESA